MTKKKNYAQQGVWQYGEATIATIYTLDFLSKEQKDKIFHRNAEPFFEKEFAVK